MKSTYKFQYILGIVFFFASQMVFSQVVNSVKQENKVGSTKKDNGNSFNDPNSKKFSDYGAVPIITKRDSLVDTVDISAEYPGGLNLMESTFKKNFDTSKIKETGTIKTTVYFVVEIDGRATYISATGSNAAFNEEAINTMKKITANKKFTPAQLNSTNVRSRFRFPFTLNIE